MSNFQIPGRSSDSEASDASTIAALREHHERYVKTMGEFSNVDDVCEIRTLRARLAQAEVRCGELEQMLIKLVDREYVVGNMAKEIAALLSPSDGGV